MATSYNLESVMQMPSKQRDAIINPIITSIIADAFESKYIRHLLQHSPHVISPSHAVTPESWAKSVNRTSMSTITKIMGKSLKQLILRAANPMSAAQMAVYSFEHNNGEPDPDWFPMTNDVVGKYADELERVHGGYAHQAAIELWDDDRVYQHHEITYAPNTQSTTTTEAIKTETQPMTNNNILENVNPAQFELLNTVLEKVTDGHVKDFNDVWGSHLRRFELEAEVGNLNNKVTELSSKLASKPSVSVPQSRNSNGAIPAGQVVMRNANDVFGTNTPLLDFEITTWEWEHEHPHVPERFDGYRFDAEKLASYLFAVEHNLNTWLVGHTGTGKSTWVEQHCAHTGTPLMRMNFDSDITRMEFVGSTQVVVDENGKQVTKFVEGFLPKSLQSPGIILLDEADAIQGDVAYVLQSVLEHKPFRLLEDGGRLVEPDPHNRIVATANTAGGGDMSGLYSSAVKQQSTAQRNRYNIFLEIDYMDVADEVALCRELVPTLSDEAGAFMFNFVTAYRESFRNGDVMEPISPRNTQTIAQAIAFFEPRIGMADSIRMAMKMNLISRANENDAAVITGIMDRLV